MGQFATAWMRRTLYFLSAAVLVVPAVMYAPNSSAVAPGACANVGGFEIDGNMTPGTPACVPTGDDWNNVNPSHTNVFGTYNTADKDNSDPANWTSSGSTPCKSQLTQAYGFTRVSGTPGHFFAYAAVERCDVTGTGGFAIEIDKAPTRTAPDGTPRPDRSQGGAVFFIDFQGASAPTLGDACLFSSQATYPSADNSPGCSTSTTGYEAAVNSAPLNDTIAGVSNIPAGGFAEFGLDVTLLTGLVPGCPAPAAASMYLRTYTGFSGLGPGSNLKGYAKPFDVAPPSTCVAPTITTTATPGNGTVDGLTAVAPGTSEHDVATVTGSGGAGVGTVQFTLCDPTQVVTNGGDCSAGGDAVGTPVSLNGSGNATSPSVPGTGLPNDTAPGKYCWRADFTPVNDHNYTAGTHTNSTTECFTVVHASPTISTSSSAVTGNGAANGSVGFTVLGDVATLSGVVSGADLSSQHVTFTLYGPASAAPSSATSCKSAPVATGPEDVTLVQKDATTWTATAPTFTPTSAMGAGYYTWVASYAGDTINDAANGTCTDANETAHLVGPAVSLTKGTPHSTIVAGDQVVYDINVDNTGAGSAANVVVTDTLPVLAGGGTWSLTATSGYNCVLGTTAGHQVVTCDVGTLNPIGLTKIAEVTATTGPLDCPSISNSAVLTADPNTLVTAGPIVVTVQCPHLTIGKTADAATVNVGQSIGFHVTVTNDGTGTASGVLLSDPLPTGPGIVWSIAGTTGPLTCGIVSNTLSCTGTLAQGATETVHVTSPTSWTTQGEATINSCLGGNGSGVYHNTATVSATNVIGTPNASADTQVLCPNLSITKSADADTVNAGTPIGFTVTVHNTGAGDATGVTVSDPLPTGTGITWTIDAVGTSGPLSCGISAGTLSCTGTLPAGTSEIVHVTSPTQFLSCKTYDNNAQVTAGNDPQAPSASASTTVDCAALVIGKTSDAPSVSVGTDIGFTVTIHNTGTGTASGVVISDPLPGGPGVSWSIKTQTGPLTCSITGTAPSQSLGCTGTMAPDALETVHITSHTEYVTNGDVTINSCLGGDGSGTYNNTAQETWSNGPIDPISSNQASEQVLCPSLTLTKTPDAASVSAGSQIGFTVTVTNGGPGIARNAMINDAPLPAGTGVDWMIDAGGTTAAGCTIGGTVGAQTLSCALGDLGPEANVHVHIISATTGDSCGTYDNTATLTVDNAPGLTAHASTAVDCAAPLLVKSSDVSVVSAGDQIGFTITLSNGSAAGTGTLTGAVIDDPLPGGSGVNWSIDSGPDNCSILGTAPTQTLHCTAVDLTPGASESVHVISATSPASCQNYPNLATASASNHADVTASASTTVLCPQLTLSKTADSTTPVDAGSPIGFTITVSNADSEGTGTARGVVINDPLPGGPGVTWSIPTGLPSNCSITGTAPTQTLVCTAVTLEPGASETVHVTSPTQFASCAQYNNEATASADNAATLHASASTTVQCPALAITKTADTASVASGSQIGFTVEAKNTGAGTAVGATINDPLPAGSGVSWSIDASKTTATGCAITGAVGSQVLACALGDLASGADVKVHVVSATTTASCKVYDNTATLSASNAPDGSASASTNVLCALPTSISRSRTPLAVTGAGPIGPELGWALALIVSGGLALLASSLRPRPRRSH